jgi:hypothetical protein
MSTNMRVFLILIFCAQALFGQDEPARAQVNEALRGMYPLATIRVDGPNVPRGGATFVLKVGGIGAVPANQSEDRFTRLVTRVVDSAITARNQAPNAITLQAGERVLLLGVLWTPDNWIEFRFRTIQAFPRLINGQTINETYKGTILFNTSETPTSLDGVKRTTERLLVREDELNQPKTIRLGQSETEVAEMLGPPPRRAVLDAKTIYVYPDMKVVFQGGEVIDVQ